MKTSFKFSIIMILISTMFTISIMASEGQKENLPEPDEFIKVDFMPELIHSEIPVYPESAKKLDQTAVLWIKALVNKEGKVKKAFVSKCSNEDKGFEQAAIDAALKSVYKPAIQNMKPVAVWVTYKMVFSLDEDCPKKPE